jgi:hypothetical protein
MELESDQGVEEVAKHLYFVVLKAPIAPDSFALPPNGDVVARISGSCVHFFWPKEKTLGPLLVRKKDDVTDCSARKPFLEECVV